jgi:hypothetical protein
MFEMSSIEYIILEKKYGVTLGLYLSNIEGKTAVHNPIRFDNVASYVEVCCEYGDFRVA